MSSEQIKAEIAFEYRRKAIEKILLAELTKYNGDFSGGDDIDRFENQIIRLISFTPENQINDLITYVETELNTVTKNHVWYSLFNEVDDTKMFTSSENNRKRLIQTLTKLFFKSKRFDDEKLKLQELAKNLDSSLIKQRSIVSNYRDIFERTWSQLKLSNPAIATSAFADIYIKYDTDYVQKDGRN